MRDSLNTLTTLSPLDGRYARDVEPLRRHLTELGLIRERVAVEIRYLCALAAHEGIPEVPAFSSDQTQGLEAIVEAFAEEDAVQVRETEARIKHDVKAVEYFVKEKVKAIPGLEGIVEFVHFALTSEDVTNLAYGNMIHGALRGVTLPMLEQVIADLAALAEQWKDQAMLGMTHGQPATPTTVGRELLVFVGRLERQLRTLESFRMQGKFGGAVGNFSAHRAAYPAVDWEAFGRSFVEKNGLQPIAPTTQINPHDDIAELCHSLEAINAIILDLSTDMWLYISRGVFRQKAIAGEIGSSTMPHKVNPINFENAEGNAKMSTGLAHVLATELPRSRMQRDLSDSTLQRNIGMVFGFQHLALTSLRRGLGKLEIDQDRLTSELAANPEIHAEAIQTVLRKCGVPGGYEMLKELTRGRRVTREEFLAFIDELPIPGPEREALKTRF